MGKFASLMFYRKTHCSRKLSDVVVAEMLKKGGRREKGKRTGRKRKRSERYKGRGEKEGKKEGMKRSRMGPHVGKKSKVFKKKRK